MTKNLRPFDRLLKIISELREKCPWDKEQTMESLRTLTIEETYELANAILENDNEEIKKELGDLIMHVVFYAKIASEKNDFDINDVINSICDKLIYRHPHVYNEVKVKDTDEVKRNWEHLKMIEKGGNKSVLSGVPPSLPAMIKAQRLQSKARGVGFDWKRKEQVWKKVQEEINELGDEMESGNEELKEKEFGDVFFALVNAARLYGVNPENALEKTNLEFIRRFNYMEKEAKNQKKAINELDIIEMEKLWKEAKKNIE